MNATLSTLAVRVTKVFHRQKSERDACAVCDAFLKTLRKVPKQSKPDANDSIVAQVTKYKSGKVVVTEL